MDENQPNAPLTPSTPPSQQSRGRDAVDDVTTAIRDFINKVPETVNKAVERAMNVRDTTVLLRLDDKESDAIDTLVSAGIFRSRNDAATFLIKEGIKAQSALFERIQSKLDEIERLRSELRQTVTPDIQQ
jgi:TRAP-type mannitol/chloroaromatic compound transport system substrate-binding protein